MNRPVVSRRGAGRELAVSLGARERWESIASRHHGIGFRANGSLTVAGTPEEEAVLERAAALGPPPDDDGDRPVATGRHHDVDEAPYEHFVASLRVDVASGVQLVLGRGGRGMTLAPTIAVETFG